MVFKDSLHRIPRMKMDYEPSEAEDFFGLRQLYPQSSSADTSYDLVAVHGLAGGPISTWKHHNGSLWFKWLASAIPSLRILVYGYRASDVYLKSDDATASTDRVFTFSESLCAALRKYRIRKDNPITFLGHGVGGIIIKNALTYCTARRTLFGDIVDQTHHIIFLDTPYLGLDVTKWKAIYGQLATAQAKVQFNLWSTALQDLSTTFAEIVSRPSMHITTVESTEPTETPGGEVLVMPVGSARLSNTKQEIILHMHAVSHLTICKFDKPENPNYALLQEAIQTEIEILKTKHSSSILPVTDIHTLTLTMRTDLELQRLAKLAQQSHGNLDKILQAQAQSTSRDLQAEIERRRLQKKADREKYLNWLWPYQDKTDENSINWARDLEQSSVAVDDTCTWLFDHPEFISWRKSDSSKLALLHGVQGCGKSTLLAYLIKYLRARGNLVVYYFCNNKSSSPVSRLRALGYQLVRRFDDEMVIQVLSDRYEKTPDEIGTVAAAKGILKDALLASPPCIMVIDALDEISTIDGDRGIFIKVLMSLIRDIPFDLKIMCSSRNVQSIFDLLALEKFGVANIVITPELIKDDISKVIKNEIRESGLQRRLQNEENVEFVSRNLLEGSQGMFLLPVMMIKDLISKPTLQDVYDFFNELPTDLDEYYSSILEKVDSSKLGMNSGSGADCSGKRALIVLTWGRVNFTAAQLREVLSFDGTRLLDLESDIKNAFGCLISVEDGQIKLSHPSVRRYLLKSQRFRASKWYGKLTTPDPEKYLAELCLRYLKHCHISISRPPCRFSPSDVPSLKDRYPFLDYASVHWLSHCSAAKLPRTLVPKILDLVCSNSSRRLLGWYYATIHFLQGTEGFSAICRALQTFVLGLQTREGHEQMDDNLLQQIYEIDKGLRRMLRFEALWGQGVLLCPGELYTLAPLLKDPYRSVGPFQQQSLLLQDFVSITTRHGPLLDKRHLDHKFDRFLLTDTYIFMWTSLMPCTPYDRRYHRPLDPLASVEIQFRLESIFSSIHEGEERAGIDPADVGSFPASCVLSKSRQNVAVVWPRFSSDKLGPVCVKTYLWGLLEHDDASFLTFIPWTVASPLDPCRADLTSSCTFRNSRQPVAFTEDSLQLWTAGGLYDINSGRHYPPPQLFYDRQMSELTFADYGNAIVGLRDGTQLEVYELRPDHCQLRATANDVNHVLAVSPHGTFALCLSRSTSLVDVPHPIPHCDEEIGLLVDDGRYLTLWRYAINAASNVDESDLKDLPSLQYFYNNGGLQAFSENEAILVLCVPTIPAWSLLAFDLQANDIVRSAWKVEYSKLFEGADLTSFCFSRSQDRQLYLLDAFGNMRTLLISRESEAPSTIPVEEQPMLFSGVLSERFRRQVYSSSINPMTYCQNRAQLLNEDPQNSFPNPSFEAFLTDVESLSSARPGNLSTAFIRHFRSIKSDTVVVDCDSILQAMARGLKIDPYSWPTLSMDAQSAIEATTIGMKNVIVDYKLEPEESLKDAPPRITTSVTLDHSVTRAFFHSVIYNPVASSRGQPRWMLTTIMDIRSIETPKARKTGQWLIGIVGTVSQENIASTYHEESKLLAFSVSLLYNDRATQTRSWFLTRLCLCNLFEPLYHNSQTDERGTFLDSLSYTLPEPCITEMKFSPDARYLYGISQGFSNCVFQFDVKKGMTIRKISTADYNLDCMTLANNGDDLYLGGALGPQVLQLTLPFQTKDKVKIRQVFTGPHIQKKYDRLVLLNRTTSETRLAAVFTGRNYIRKDGVEGGNALEPIILTALEEDVGQWLETDVVTEEVYDAEDDDAEVLRKSVKEVNRSYDTWVFQWNSAANEIQQRWFHIPGEWPVESKGSPNWATGEQQAPLLVVSLLAAVVLLYWF